MRTGHSHIQLRGPRSRWPAALVAIAVLISLTGCGSRASDAEIAEALHGPGPYVASAGAPSAAVPADSGAQAGPVAAADTVVAPAVPGAGAALEPSQVVNGAANAPARTTGGKSAPAGKVAAESPRAANLSPVKIGMLGSFSGVLGSITSSGPKTLAAWASYTNARGGLNGHPVKLIVADDQGDPAASMTLARRLVEGDRVIAMAGNILVFAFAQVEKYLAEKKIPMIGGDGVDPGWFTSKVGFPISAPVSVQIIKGLKMLVDQGAKKIGVFYCLEVASLCSYLNSELLKSEVGPYVEQSYQVSLVAPSYTSQCLRMKSAGIDTLYLLMDTPAATRAVQNCATQNFRPTVMLLGNTTSEEAPTVAALADALVPASTAPPNLTGLPTVARFRSAMATYAPTLGQNGVSNLAWASGELLALVGANLSANPKSSEFFDALWKVKNETFGGFTTPLTYVKGGLPAIKHCVFIWGMEGGKFSAPAGPKPVC